ncbi:hypothetical protein CMO91_03840 [Candidatus Woesearchaeota archaeon]|jgi:hypothetical protein|nr:hypothetical protein [Candidatus Woesearchaeota archaeon]|tara:strand:- start:196 stop:468 length:273 start_codon:yes stop_codon:yes gene_type:complete
MRLAAVSNIMDTLKSARNKVMVGAGLLYLSVPAAEAHTTEHSPHVAAGVWGVSTGYFTARAFEERNRDGGSSRMYTVLSIISAGAMVYCW